jgi:hypothetical protein
VDKNDSGTVEWDEFRRVGLKLKLLADVAPHAGSVPGETDYRRLASGSSKGTRPMDKDFERAVTSIQAAGRGKISRARSREIKRGRQAAAWGAAPACRPVVRARRLAADAGGVGTLACATTYNLVPPSACASLKR